MRIYISGPISGIPHDVYISNFWIKEMELAKRYPDAEIFNPALAHNNMPGWMEHSHYMELCKAELAWCDTVYFMKGWKESKGSRMERKWAEDMGLKIMEEEDA